MVKKKKLHQLLASKPSRKKPYIPKRYFERPWIPPPIDPESGRPEDKDHYNYKILLGEKMRDRLPYLKIDYEFYGLPSFYHARYDRYVNYRPDIFIEHHDDRKKQSWFSDIEINGLIHYKSKDQILKVKERKDLVYPTLKALKAIGKEDYETIASYIIIDKDTFEYMPINDIVIGTKWEVLNGGLAPVDIDQILVNLLKVAK